MKQHITAKQRDELSEEGGNTLRHWVLSKGYVLDTKLSIGQMIEFLDEHNERKYWMADYVGDNKTLCDALWEACKEILEE